MLILWLSVAICCQDPVYDPAPFVSRIQIVDEEAKNHCHGVDSSADSPKASILTSQQNCIARGTSKESETARRSFLNDPELLLVHGLPGIILSLQPESHGWYCKERIAPVQPWKAFLRI